MAILQNNQINKLSDAEKVGLTSLDIDGGTDTGADLLTTDLMIVDDGANGTNRKSALSRLITLNEASMDALNGSNSVTIGLDGNTTLKTNTAHDLIMRATADRGFIQIADALHGDITLSPNGNGHVKLPGAYDLATAGFDSDCVVPKHYVDNLAVGIHWNRAVKLATTAVLPDDAVPVYNAGAKTLTASGNKAIGNIDGRSLNVSDRILVKNQPGRKGSIEFDCDLVPAASETLAIEVNDQYWLLTFVDGDTHDQWGGQGLIGDKFTINVKRNTVGESVDTVAASIRSVFAPGMTKDKIGSSGASNTIKLSQKRPHAQTVVNNSTPSVAGSFPADDETAVVGLSSYNGAYDVSNVGNDGSAPWVLTRAADWRGNASSYAVFVKQGSTLEDTGWTQVSDDFADVDKAHQEMVQFTGPGMINAGLGLAKAGNNLDIDIRSTSVLSGGIAKEDVIMVHDDNNGNLIGKLSVDDLSIFLVGGVNSGLKETDGVMALDMKRLASIKEVDGGNITNVTQNGRANTLKIDNIFTGASLAASAHPFYGDHCVYVNGLLGEEFITATDVTSAGALSGANQYMFKLGDNPGDVDFFYTEDASLNMVTGKYAGGDFTIKKSFLA